MSVRAHAVHRLPGRIRFRVPDRRGDGAFFDEVEKRFERLEGVRDVETNSTTGSVLVRCDATLEELLNATLGSDLGELLQLVESAPPLAQQFRSAMTAIDGNVRAYTEDELDLTTLAALALLAMAGVQLWRGRQPVLAVSLAWYASELLRRGGRAAETAAR
jgi:Heavy metal associated domain 2